MERRSFLEIARLPCLPNAGEVEGKTTFRGHVFKIDNRSTAQRKETLRSCSVGRFDRDVGCLDRIGKWAAKNWKIPTGVTVSPLPDSLLLFRLSSEKEAKRVLKEGKREWGDALLLLDVWYYRVGCANLMKKRKERRLLLYGLPLHLWCRKLFVAIGDLCGGFLKLDTDDLGDTETVVIIISDGGEIPPFVLVEDDAVAYKVALLEGATPQLVPKHDSLVGRDLSKLITEEEWWRRHDHHAGKATAKSGPHRNMQKIAKTGGQGHVARHVNHARERRLFPKLRAGLVADGQVAAGRDGHDAAFNRGLNFSGYDAAFNRGFNLTGPKALMQNRFGPPAIGPNSGKSTWADDSSSSVGFKNGASKWAQKKPKHFTKNRPKDLNPLAQPQSFYRKDYQRLRKDLQKLPENEGSKKLKVRSTKSSAFSRISQAFEGAKVSDRDAKVLQKRRNNPCESGVVWRKERMSGKDAGSSGATAERKKGTKHPGTMKVSMNWAPKRTSQKGTFSHTSSSPSSENGNTAESEEDDHLRLTKIQPILRRRQEADMDTTSSPAAVNFIKGMLNGFSDLNAQHRNLFCSIFHSESRSSVHGPETEIGQEIIP